MKLSKIAWHNLWRSKRRTLITVFSIGFGLMLSVTFTGSGDYMYANMINTGANMGMGHITIEPQGYNQTPALNKRLKQTNLIMSHVLNIPEVENTFIRIVGQAMFGSASKNIGGMFMAVDPLRESPEYNLLIRSIVRGRLFTSADGRGVVIGHKMAKKLHLTIGKKLIYTTTDINGEIISEIARVTGIFQTGLDEIDGAMVLLPINRVRATLNYVAEDATLMAVIIKDHRMIENVRDQINRIINNPECEVLTWKQTQPDLAGIITLDRTGNYIIQFLIGLLIAAGIFNTLFMSVLERSREFGVMMAVGMAPKTLFRLVFIESFWLALIGIILGIIITIPWFAYLYNVGIDFSGTIGNDYNAGGVLIDPVLKVRLYKESIISILTSVFLLTLLSGLYPAWRAGRIPPVESLKTI